MNRTIPPAAPSDTSARILPTSIFLLEILAKESPSGHGREHADLVTFTQLVVCLDDLEVDGVADRFVKLPQSRMETLQPSREVLYSRGAFDADLFSALPRSIPGRGEVDNSDAHAHPPIAFMFLGFSHPSLIQGMYPIPSGFFQTAFLISSAIAASVAPFLRECLRSW